MAASDWPGGVEVPHQWGSCATADTPTGASVLDYVRTMHAKDPDRYGASLGPEHTCALLALIDQHTKALAEARSAARQLGYDTGWGDATAGRARRDVR